MIVLALLIAIGVAARIAPLFDRDGRIFKQFPTEDGYLMLQIARNIALGNGFSTAAGTIPTNGTQPLTTVLYAGLFYLAGAERKLGVALILALQFAGTTLAAWILYRLGSALLSGWRSLSAAPALAACVWYAGPMTVTNTSNCLETWAYALAVIVAFALYARYLVRQPTMPRSIGFGVILGLAFLARNDACFLILAFCLVHILAGRDAGWPGVAPRIAQAIAMGLTSIAVSLPWLVFNKARFGSIVPISGHAESADAKFAENLGLWPASMAEYVLAVVTIPNHLYGHPIVIALCLTLLAAFGVATAALARAADARLRLLLNVFVLYATLLSLFYGLYFGAGHFMARYLFPLSPGLALIWAVLVVIALRTCRTRGLRGGAGLALLVIVSAVAAQNARIYRNGARHAHWQIIEWVQEHVRADEWVGAVQTGTLGFFHDRTINLDGKVNPEALKARATHSIPAYVVESKIAYLADWDIDIWMQYPEIREHFDLVAKQSTPPLAVLKRKTASTTH
ncbi:MAG: hypothetical protein AMXMBFR4_03590 [Candidatus Hydrogenedentota bacterium]